MRYNFLNMEAELLKIEANCLDTEIICFINLLKTFNLTINRLREKIFQF